jgi:FkbM family methyltransferase
MNTRMLRTKLTPWLASNRRSAPLRQINRLCRVFQEMSANLNYDLWRNGEAWLVDTLSPDMRVIFDVGAHTGEWTSCVRDLAPHAEVHAFELIPETAEKLSARFAHDPKVHVNGVGLLDVVDKKIVKHYPSAPTSSSVAGFPHDIPFEEISLPVTTGERYCQDHSLNSVDLLKVDAEGADHLVLHGFGDMFRERKIRAVQFEYGRAAIFSKFLLKDFYDFFAEYDMAVGKLFPGWVEFRQYDAWRDEDFLGPNYVAVRKEDEVTLGLLTS